MFKIFVTEKWGWAVLQNRQIRCCLSCGYMGICCINASWHCEWHSSHWKECSCNPILEQLFLFPLISMRARLEASSQRWLCIDADAGAGLRCWKGGSSSEFTFLGQCSFCSECLAKVYRGRHTTMYAIWWINVVLKVWIWSSVLSKFMSEYWSRCSDFVSQVGCGQVQSQRLTD